ncbi:TetR/AcrR family transcriptional regulator [Streptomyces ochraceiscleroticus]|uniref:TetR/AcrR family transcriptional regulator n=1 Tax=Streptomyces ochraceiscleroticus TaxID=47761 RepID=A0ABW1MS42_9ACTN|nr:TetR/AcrR family transcriptional regulator [Streptomyces ochraceiscleroticus]
MAERGASERTGVVPAGADVQRERILRAAALALAEHGFDAARLRDVANSAQVSIGSIQHHFETRDALFRHAFEWSIGELIGRWRCTAVGEPDPWRRFELLVRELTGDPDLIRRCTTWTEFCASAARHEELRDGIRRVHDEWRALVSGILAEGVATGEFAPVMSQEAAVGAVMAVVDGCDMTIAAAGGMTPERYAEVLLGTGRAVFGVRNVRSGA